MLYIPVVVVVVVVIVVKYIFSHDPEMSFDFGQVRDRFNGGCAPKYNWVNKLLCVA